MTGCEPAVGYAPDGWLKTGHINWSKDYEEFKLEISEIGGMLHQSSVSSLITLIPKSDETMKLKAVILKSMGKEYEAKLIETNLYQANNKVLDTRATWELGKKISENLHPPLEMEIKIVVRAEERTVKFPLAKVFGLQNG